jgi:hypothetical protein
MLLYGLLVQHSSRSACSTSYAMQALVRAHQVQVE